MPTRYEGAVGVYSKCAGGPVRDHIKMMEGFLCNDLCHRLSRPCCQHVYSRAGRCQRVYSRAHAQVALGSATLALHCR